MRLAIIALITFAWVLLALCIVVLFHQVSLLDARVDNIEMSR